MQLSVHVPEQHDLNDPTVELDPHSLQNWLAGLPMLNSSESIYQVLYALEPLNEQKIDSQLRFRLLNIYQPVVHKLYETDAADSVAQQRQAGLPGQMAADNIERLCLAMADGYKLVVKAWFAEGVQRSDPQLFARGLRRAFRQLTWTMLHSYRNVRSLPQYLLFEMHQLYRFARHFGVQSTIDTLSKGGNSASMADYYHAAMALTLMTGRIQAKRLERIFQVLLHYGRDIHITADNTWLDNPQALYLIDLMSDAAPKNCAGLTSPASGEELCIMDVAGMIDALHQKMAARPAEQRFTGPEPIILKAIAPV